MSLRVNRRPPGARIVGPEFGNQRAEVEQPIDTAQQVIRRNELIEPHRMEQRLRPLQLPAGTESEVRSTFNTAFFSSHKCFLYSQPSKARALPCTEPPSRVANVTWRR
jgi:hypothetical protein